MTVGPKNYVGRVPYVYHGKSKKKKKRKRGPPPKKRRGPKQIIWSKGHMIFGRGDYHWQHELCFYGWRRGNRPQFYGDRNQTTVWIVDNPRGKEHPTQKPVELFIRPIANNTRAGDIAYEPFAGSGPQFIAAEQLGRRCYGLEIEPRYVDVCVNRWQNFTGKQATLDGDGRTFAEIATERGAAPTPALC